MSDVDFSGVKAAVIAKATAETQELHNLNDRIKAAAGDSSKINDVIDQTEDQEIVAKREKVKAAEAKIKELKAELVEWAKSQIQEDGFDLEAAQKTLAEKKTATKSFLLQSKGMLEGLGLSNEEVQEIQDLLDNLPGRTLAGSNASGRSPEEMTRIRNWAKENGMEVADRGRIAADVIKAYEDAKAA